MRIKVSKDRTEIYTWKRIFFTLCFAVFCIIDQRTKTGSGLDGIIETFRNAMGLVLGGILFSHYRWEDFKLRKMPYIIWGALSAVGGVCAFIWGMKNRTFLNEWTVLILDVILWGYILIHTFIDVILEKKYPPVRNRFFVVWGIMILLMMLSRSDYSWPLCYGVMFGCFYLTDFTAEEQKDLWQGCLDGIILSLVLFQGFCCAFRPYDVVRYIGVHNNCNLNALYYLAVLAASFVKILYLTKTGAYKWLRAFYWLTAGVVLAFVFMTISRSAWVTAFAMSLLFLGLLNGITQKKRFIRNGLVLILCAVLMFPVSFGTARYLPPVFHHPIWFWGEWDEGKVHSWDPWDSEKYVDVELLMESALGRVVQSLEELWKHSPFLLKSDAAEAVEDPRIAAAVLTESDYYDGFIVRKTIYQYYFEHLNWRGYPYEEQGFQLTPFYWIGHAHNIYLQYGTDFGIPVMILFIILILWGGILIWKKSRAGTSAADMAALFFILIPAVFGLFEYAWGVGSLSITLLFISWRQIVRKDA